MGFKPDLDALVLAALENGEKHGYAIAREIERATEGQFKLAEGRLYPALHRLSEDGLVESDWLMQEGKPNRRVYRLTEKGVGHLAKKRADWSKFFNAVNHALAPNKPLTPREGS